MNIQRWTLGLRLRLRLRERPDIPLYTRKPIKPTRSRHLLVLECGGTISAAMWHAHKLAGCRAYVPGFSIARQNTQPLPLIVDARYLRVLTLAECNSGMINEWSKLTPAVSDNALPSVKHSASGTWLATETGQPLQTSTNPELRMKAA